MEFLVGTGTPSGLSRPTRRSTPNAASCDDQQSTARVPNDEGHVPLDEKAGEADCGNVLVHLFIFDRDTEVIKAAMKRAGMGALTAKQARQILDDISGVAIYRDRFRIRPYPKASAISSPP